MTFLDKGHRISRLVNFKEKVIFNKIKTLSFQSENQILSLTPRMKINFNRQSLAVKKEVYCNRKVKIVLSQKNRVSLRHAVTLSLLRFERRVCDIFALYICFNDYDTMAHLLRCFLRLKDCVKMSSCIKKLQEFVF